jgi:hypothetical protein
MVRGLAAATMLLSLMGPAPGNVGGCGSATPLASPRQFCTDRSFWECRRDQFAGRITDAQYGECLAEIEGACSAFVWPPGCFPTPAQADGCLLLLQRTDLSNVSTPDLLASFPDCNLCM